MAKTLKQAYKTHSNIQLVSSGLVLWAEVCQALHLPLREGEGQEDSDSHEDWLSGVQQERGSCQEPLPPQTTPEMEETRKNKRGRDRWGSRKGSSPRTSGQGKCNSQRWKGPGGKAGSTLGQDQGEVNQEHQVPGGRLSGKRDPVPLAT